MATIRTAIELQDNFTSVLYQVINSVNLGLSAMGELNQTMNSPIDTASLEGARNAIDQATIAVQQLDAAMQGIETPGMDSPTAPTNSAPVQLPVEPVVPDPLVEPQPPVQIPVEWQSDNLEVFTSTGVERFNQEIQSANNMLNTLNQTQNQIAATAAQTDLFPANAVADMNNMQNRLNAVQQRIRQIESNPINMGSEAANAELEQLRGQLNQAVQQQQALNRAVENMDVESANAAYLQLSNTVSNTERYIRDNVTEQGQFNRTIENGTQEANQLMNTIKGAVAAYATLQTAGKALELSDQLTSTTARLNMMNDGLQTTEDLQNMIFLSAERSRGAYQQTADAVSKLGLMAGDAFSSSEEIIAFTEQLNKQFTIAGTEAAGIDAAMLQLTQAMGSGILRGEEYNSILEQAPNIIQAIADYMDVPKGQLKDMAAEGQITAEIVKNAMFAAADETNAKFNSMPQTFSQIWTSFENNALMAFQPVLQRLNALANSADFQNFVNGAIAAMSIVAGVVLSIFELVAAIGSFASENWSILEPIIMGIVTALGLYYGAMLLYNTITGISAGITAAKAAIEKVHAAATMMQTGATFAATAAQYGFNAALLACPITWIIILIIAVIALFYAVIAIINKVAGTSISATGIICRALAAAGAFIWNLVLGALELVLGVINYLINPFIEIANFIGNVFTNPVSSIIYLFQGMADNVLGILQKIASALDFVFGSNMAATVQGWRDGLKSSADALVAEYAPNENYQDVMNNLDLSVEGLGLDRLAYGDAWDAGYNFGEGIDESIGSFDPSSLFDTNVPGADAYSDLSDYGSDISDIAGNTGDIKDSLDITEEDLKYLRDIAEQETINRFTTAEISVDMSGMQNTVNNNGDLDGFVSGLTDAVNEAIDTMAEGVHE